jgi:hypothetical protein
MKRFITILLVLVFSFAFIGCEEEIQSSLEGQMKTESENIGKNQQSLVTAQPAPQLKWSNERDNIIKRVTRFNDPNKLGYIYLFALNGEPIAYSVVNGKVSCTSSYVVPDENVIDGNHAIGYSNASRELNPIVVQQADVDGSYGTNGEGIFWFDENDVMWQWNQGYLYTDQPIQIWSVRKMNGK